MLKNKFEILGSLVILVFAAAIYLYKLESIPNGFYVDEAVVAYNAKSILETGKDAFGQPYPILFRLLGSYTPPLFIYIAAAFIKFFGSGIFVIRSISAISALTSIVFFYLLAKKLNIYKNRWSCLVTTAFYAISPWLIFNARLGYEVTLAYTLFNIGVYFLVLSIKLPKYYILSATFLSLATYAAHTQRFLVPIFIAGYLILFKGVLLKKENTKHLFWAALTTFILQIPHFTVIATPAFWVKNQRLLENSNVVQNIVNQIFSYLSTKNIFFELNDIDAQHTIPGISVAYNWMVIPFLIGVFILVKRRIEVGHKLLILLFITSLIPAILSGEFISIQRALAFALPLFVVIGIGMDKILSKLPMVVNYPAVLVLIFGSTLMLYRSYFVLFPVERADAWNYGYDKLANFIKENPDKKFVVDNSRNPRNYILLLYHLNYPPEVYQNEVDQKYKEGYYHSLPPENSYKFGNIEVREIDWQRDSYLEQIIVGDALSVSESQAKDHLLTKVGEIKNPINNPILIFYATNPDEKCKVSYNRLCDNR